MSDACPFTGRLLDHATFGDGTPRALIEQLRGERPVFWEADEFAGGGHWVVLLQEHIDIVLKHPERFSSRFGPLLEDMPPELLPEQQNSLNFMDPPRQREYRAIVDWAFRPAAIALRRPRMQQQARTILDNIIGRGECEFVADVAQPLPVLVMCDLLGVPVADGPLVVGLVNAMTMGDDPEFAANRAAGFAASMQLIEFGAALAATHRRNPQDSMTQEMITPGERGDGLDDREFGRFFNNLIAGGVETTRNTLAWLIYELIRHPEQYRLLQQDASLVEDAVEEILRHRNTVVYLRRTSTCEQEFCGHQLRTGDKVICVLGAPNRDPRFFVDPERFDITRPRREAVRRNYRTFGAGAHFCIGVHQARLNLCVMLEEIVRRIDDLRLLGEPERARSYFMDGFKRMRIGYRAR